MENNSNAIDTQAIAPATIEELQAKIRQIEAEAAKVKMENQAYKEEKRKHQEEEALKAWARTEKRFTSTRNTLVLRRIKNHKEIAPAIDVRDYLELYDMKEPETAEGTKTRVSDDEMKVYQAMKAEGVADITPTMVKNRLEGKGGDDSSDSEEEPDSES